jgi:hypothetical protein
MGKISTLKKEDFELALETIMGNAGSAVIFKKRTVSTIRIGGESMAIYDTKGYDTRPFLNNKKLTKEKAISFFAQISKAVNKYIILHDYNIEEIKFKKDKIVYANKELFESMAPGTIWWNIDIDNAYWQMMHRHGIIPDKTYNNYKPKYEYKEVKQMAIGLVSNECSAQYIVEGKFLVDESNGQRVIISEYKPQWKTVYNNVRAMTFNVISDLVDMIAKENLISWNIDSVSFFEPELDKIQKYLKENNYDFKILYCQKKDKITYSQGEKVFQNGKKLTDRAQIKKYLRIVF